MNKVVRIILGILVGLIILGIVGVTITYTKLMEPVSSSDEIVTVQIPSGASATTIGTQLKNSGLIKSEWAFKVYTKMHKINDMQAGEYDLKKNMPVSQIVNELEKGPDSSRKTVNITFLEGKNMRWIAKTIADKTNNSEDDVFDKLKDEKYINSVIDKYWFVTDEIKNEDIYYSLEGYLFPDTYNFKNKDVAVEDIFNAMLDQMEKKLEPFKSKIEDKNFSVHKLFTVASIVELEASNVFDKVGVASVIYNRLEANMAIGSDVTTYYAVKADMSERDLKQSELNKYNPYNTRGPKMNGKLPVGPISTVGVDSIKAALYPDETDDLYFVADKNGKVYFGKTQAEHDQNIKKLKEQGLWFSYED